MAKQRDPSIGVSLLPADYLALLTAAKRQKVSLAKFIRTLIEQALSA